MSAQIFAHPNFFAPPVVQGRLQGRHPKGIGNLGNVRYEHRKAAREAEKLAEEIGACRRSIGFATEHIKHCRATLAALTQATTSNMKTPMG